MPLRFATTADAQRIAQHLQDFAAIAGTEVKIDLPRIRRSVTDQNKIALIDTATGFFCLLSINRAAHEIEVEGLFPRGANAASLKPLLKNAFVRGLARVPAAAGWRVFAEFPWGKDANGQYDGGWDYCQTWHALFPTTTVRLHNPALPRGGAIIEGTLGSLAS
jgi:hypothetical protein